MSRHPADLAKQLYGPGLEQLKASLGDMGESLAFACHELSRDLSLERVDQMLPRLKAGENTLVQMRKTLAAQETTAWGTG